MSAKRKVPDSGVSSESPRRPPPRQEPVSCQTCRKRKLKCDRQQPCYNCRSRGISCSYGSSNATASANSNANANANVSGYQNVAPPVTHTPTNTIVASALVHHDTTAKPAASSEIARVDAPDEGRLRPQDTVEHERTADWLEKIMMGPRIPDALPPSIKNKLLTTAHTAFSSTNLTAFLPREAEAFILFKYYVDHVGYLYHVIIPSQVQSQINAIYQSVHDAQSSSSPTRSATVDLNHLALLFSILAAASYFQNIGKSDCTPADERRFREYTTLVAAALTHSDYMNYPTVEGLQATIIVSQFLPNNGQDSSVRAVFHTGALANQCRAMGLLQIDSAHNKEFRKKHGFDPVELELKRRLAWSVVSTDWYLIRASTYI
jgi:Fungal Zn(2)-Cys(6) binuclear cluster domain